MRTLILGEEFLIERRGTNGDFAAAVRLIGELDGRVDALGLGGIDLYVFAAGRRYAFRDARRLAAAARKTPVVDGSGLKNTLERRVVKWIEREGVLPLRDRKVLLVSAVDRFGMAEALAEAGCRLTMGDLIFALGVPFPIKSFTTLNLLARILLPLICLAPFQWIYPTGEKQEQVTGGSKYARYFEDAEVIAGDFHFIRRYMPGSLAGKSIITNTVTREDVKILKKRYLHCLITTTPELEGRSFGTNVLEAVLVAAAGKPSGGLTPADYNDLLDRIEFAPRVELLNP